MARCYGKLIVMVALAIELMLPHPKGLAQEKMQYPTSKKIDQVDEYFGYRVGDEYRWLEDDVRESADVEEWVEAQNKVTMGYLEGLPYRKEIEDRLTQLWDYEKYGTPFKAGGRYYYSKNDGLQNQSVVYRQDSLDSEPTILIDPNQWSDDGTVALGGMAFSDDGKYVAYGVQESGSDWRTWYVMEIETGKKLDDKISWVKFGGAIGPATVRDFTTTVMTSRRKVRNFRASTSFKKSITTSWAHHNPKMCSCTKTTNIRNGVSARRSPKMEITWC